MPSYAFSSATFVYISLLMSPRSNWDSPTPLAASECALPPGPKGGGGAHSPAAKGVGESQIQRLEKKLSTLPTLCTLVKEYFRHEGIPWYDWQQSGHTAQLEPGLGPLTARHLQPIWIEKRLVMRMRSVIKNFTVSWSAKERWFMRMRRVIKSFTRLLPVFSLSAKEDGSCACAEWYKTLLAYCQ